MKKLIVLIALQILSVNILFAQNPMSQKKRANIWYFGRNFSYTDGCAGLDFSSGTPVAIVGGKGGSIEGPSTICDTNGVHLFHTNNTIIYNANQDTLLNGDTVLSSNTTTQGTIEIPVPGSNNLYYLFAVHGGNLGFSYSLIDMNGAAGLGEVVPNQKNIVLRTESTEKLTAVHHCNGIDIWVLTNEYLTNKFFAYLITNTGIDTIPIISMAGDTQIFAIPGSLKFAPNGRLLAKTIQDVTSDGIGAPQIYKFDNSTGIISDPITLIKDSGEYGISFSPNSKKLYIGTINGKIIQYDISIYDSATIVNSRFEVRNSYPNGVGLLQNGWDNKIYGAYGYDTLFIVINTPNGAGTLCGFEEDGPNAIPLNGGSLGAGMGNYIESYFTDDSSAFPCNVGIEEINNSTVEINLFPNPALYHLQLIVENNNQKTAIKIYTLQGKEISHLLPMENYEKLNSKQIYSFNCSQLSAGEYVIVVQFPQYKMSKKFLITSKNKKK